MAAPLFTRKTVVLAKIEATYGTDASPTEAANAILTTVPTIDTDAQLLERNYTRPSLSPTAPVTGRKLVRIGFQTELKSQTNADAGSSASPIELDPILQMAGLIPDYNTGTDVTYSPISGQAATPFKSASVYVYSGNEVLHKALGSFANLTMEFVAGQYPVLTVDIMGRYSQPYDSVSIVVDYAGDLPVMSESLSLVFGAVTGLRIPNFTINLNNEIVERPDVNSAEGLKGLRISGRRPTVTFRIEKELMATFGVYAALDAGTTYAVSFTHGATGGQKITITIPKFRFTKVGESEDAGIAMLDVEGVCAANSDAGDDELTIKFF